MFFHVPDPSIAVTPTHFFHHVAEKGKVSELNSDQLSLEPKNIQSFSEKRFFLCRIIVIQSASKSMREVH